MLLCAASAFYMAGLARVPGGWPLPLDDSYIYFGFARSAAHGDPFSWFPGNGYSSGSTSALYPLLLAPGYAAGLRDSWLGAWAAAIALACLFDLCRSLRQLVGPSWAGWLIAPVVISVPLVDWSWFSGMETALWGALMGRALRAAHQAMRADVSLRRAAQWRFGMWAALFVLTRPETIGLALPLAVAVVYNARSLSTRGSLARSLSPLAAALVAQAAANRWLTGEWSQAGAIRKLLTENPYRSDEAIALEWLKNLVVLLNQGIERRLTVAGLLVLAVACFAARRHRALTLALLAGALSTLMLVCLNETARYQNYRYVAPVLAMMIVIVVVGSLSVRSRWIAAALVATWLFAVTTDFPSQIDHFARASGNIAEQQIEVARRLEAHRPRRVLVGDAGAIPYLSGVPPIDGLGLGGFRRLPFARASVHGQPAVIELIERLPADERPDMMALYPDWFGDIVEFGTAIDAVRIEDNIICAADEKVIYRADWSALEGVPRSALQEIDIADLVSENASDYQVEHPAWVVGGTHRLDGQDRYDAGRLVATRESFRVLQSIRSARLRVRSDDRVKVRVSVQRDGQRIRGSDLALDASGAAWVEGEAHVGDLEAGDRIVLAPIEGIWRSFHLWLND